jgi:hypothetical protein
VNSSSPKHEKHFAHLVFAMKLRAVSRNMSIKTLKFVTFDATGTLLQFRKPPTKIYADFALRNGLNVDEIRLERAFKSQWKKLNLDEPHFGSCWNSWWVKFVTGTFKVIPLTIGNISSARILILQNLSL